MNRVVIIQARMGSTRLPGKIMKKIVGKTVLEHDIKRISKAANIDKIVIATSNKKQDEAIAKEAVRLGVDYYRGSEKNVLQRYYQAAKKCKADIIIRITSDCPLYDPYLLDKMLIHFTKLKCEYLSNCLKRTYPRGLDTEIFTFSALETAYKKASKNSDKEHVTPYINQRPVKFKIADYCSDTDNSKYRWTLDTKEDFCFINEIYKHLYYPDKFFTTQDILALLEKKPHLKRINSHIEQKKQ